jgi:uncharacterized membrane protein
VSKPDEREEGPSSVARVSAQAGHADPSATPNEAVVRALHLEFSGPLPHPQLLSQYNELIPNGAERIVALTEREARHRQSLEARGQLFAFVLAMVSLVGGIGLIAIGASVEVLVPLLAAIAGLGGMFIYREVQSRKDELGDWGE